MKECFGSYSREDIIKISKEIPIICKEWNELSLTCQETYFNDICIFYKTLLTVSCAYNISDLELVESLDNLLSLEYKNLILSSIGLDISQI